jgi:serine/threonine protein kinase
MRQVTPQQELQTKPLIKELVISRIAFQILNALEYLHNTKKQLHRDIKPDNILVDSQLGRAKLSDFGISKKLSGSDYQSEITNTYTGTLCYMSPERLESKDYSYPSEIWSFGVVIYEMGEGQHPYP